MANHFPPVSRPKNRFAEAWKILSAYVPAAYGPDLQRKSKFLRYRARVFDQYMQSALAHVAKTDQAYTYLQR